MTGTIFGFLVIRSDNKSMSYMSRATCQYSLLYWKTMCLQALLNKILSLSSSSCFNIQVNLIFHQWNLHFAVVHILNGLLRSAAVLYKGIVWGDEKSVGTGPSRVVVVAEAAVVAVDVGRGIYTTRPSGNICIFLANNDDDATDWKVPLRRVFCVCVWNAIMYSVSRR